MCDLVLNWFKSKTHSENQKMNMNYKKIIGFKKVNRSNKILAISANEAVVEQQQHQDLVLGRYY